MARGSRAMPAFAGLPLRARTLISRGSPAEDPNALQTRDSNDTRPVLLLAADEGRFGRLGEAATCVLTCHGGSIGGQVMQAWCPPGTRPIIGQQIVREYVYAYAAVAPELGKMTALVLPYANTKMMNLFLEQVSMEFQDYFLIIQVDGAAWHSSKDLVLTENIRLITQRLTVQNSIR